MLQSMGLQRVGHNLKTEPTELNSKEGEHRGSFPKQCLSEQQNWASVKSMCIFVTGPEQKRSQHRTVANIQESKL